MNKKMIVTDLDGTLLKMDKSLPDTTIEYLKKLKEEGYLVVIATGRNLSSAINVTKGALFANYVISDNGSVIYNMDSKEQIYISNIDNEHAKKIYKYYKEYENYIEYMDVVDTDNYNKFTKKEYSNFDFSKLVLDKDRFFDNNKPLTHITIAFKKSNIIEKFHKELSEEINDLFFMIMRDSFSEDRQIEVLNRGISKYSSIKKVSNLENILNENIIAFGDGLNDIDMIKNCGVGVAMENALEEVKQVANYFTISHNSEGVMNYLINNL